MNCDFDGLDAFFGMEMGPDVNNIDVVEDEKDMAYADQLLDELVDYLPADEVNKQSEADDDINNNVVEEDMASADHLLDELLDYLPADEVNGLAEANDAADHQAILAQLMTDAELQRAIVEATTVEPITVEPTTVEPITSVATLIPTVVEQEPSVATIWTITVPTPSTSNTNCNCSVDTSSPTPCKRGRPKKEAVKMSPYVTDKSERKKLQAQECSKRYRERKSAQWTKEGLELQLLETKNRELRAAITALELELEQIKANDVPTNADGKQLSLEFHWDLSQLTDAHEPLDDLELIGIPEGF